MVPHQSGRPMAYTQPNLCNVRPLWLTVSSEEAYLLVEDEDTGDILMPLVYMKSVLEANYSRKLSSLKHRMINLPPEFISQTEQSMKRKRGKGDDKGGSLYWQWAFEAPHDVKVVVRQALGEESTPQGHLRLILLPIAYNAMSQQAKLRQSGFFQTMHRALRASSYYKLLKLPRPEEIIAERLEEGDPQLGFLFPGPADIGRMMQKYTLTYEACQEMQSGGQSQNQLHGMVQSDMSAGALTIHGLQDAGMASAYSAGTWNSVGGGGVGMSAGGPGGPAHGGGGLSVGEAALIRARVEEVGNEVKKLRVETEGTVQALHAEVLNLRRWMVNLVNLVQEGGNAGAGGGGQQQRREGGQQQQQQQLGGQGGRGDGGQGAAQQQQQVPRVPSMVAIEQQQVPRVPSMVALSGDVSVPQNQGGMGGGMVDTTIGMGLSFGGAGAGGL